MIERKENILDDITQYIFTIFWEFSFKCLTECSKIELKSAKSNICLGGCTITSKAKTFSKKCQKTLILAFEANRAFRQIAVFVL